MTTKPGWSAVSLALIWLISALFVHQASSVPADGALRLTLAFVPLYVFPGYLTGYILRADYNHRRIQFWAVALGLGLTEALILGQLAVILGLPTMILADAILLIAAVKILWIVQLVTRLNHKEHGDASPVCGSDKWGYAFQVGLVACGLVLILLRVHQIPVYTWSPSDSWHYTQVQIQFSDNPGHMNVQEGITAPGTNRRLLWSSWLYNRAMLVDVAGADPVIAQQRDGLYALILLMVVVYVALGQDLFDSRRAGWLAAFFQLGIVLFSQAEFLWRLPEDKFVSFYAFIPLIYWLVVRLMRNFNRRDFVTFVFLTVGMSLIHPFNPVALFVTSMAFILLRWMAMRDKAYIRKTIPVASWITLLLLYPLLVQRVLTEDSLVAGAIEASQTVDWGYHLTVTWSQALQRPDYVLSVLLLPFLGLAAFRNRRDISTQFLLAISASIVALLWVPPFAALGALIMTRSQNWRIFMLLPIGYGWTWMLVSFWNRLRPYLIRIGVEESLGHVVWNIGVPVTLVLLWGWPSQFDGVVYPDSEQVPAELRSILNENRALVGSGRVLTTEQWSLILPTLWPDATLAFWRNGLFQPQAYRDLMTVMNTDGDVDLASVLKKYGIEYLLLPNAVPLVQVINTTWPCCVDRARGDHSSLFEFRYPIPTAPAQLDEITFPSDVQFDDFVVLKGYAVTELSDALIVTLFWRPLRQTDVPYTVFVHLSGENNPLTGNPLWVQDDHPPRLGQTPTTRWTPGILLRDPYRLELGGLPSGDYSISAGLYGPDGTRVMATESSEQVKGDAVELLRLTVDSNRRVTSISAY